MPAGLGLGRDDPSWCIIRGSAAAGSGVRRIAGIEVEDVNACWLWVGVGAFSKPSTRTALLGRGVFA